MGYMRHHAVIVSSWNNESIARAHRKAQELFERTVSNLVRSEWNGYQSFLVAPDGSKEGWPESDAGDARRAEFVSWLDEQRYEDGSTNLRWVDVQFADDERETKVVRDSDSTHPDGEDL